MLDSVKEYLPTLCKPEVLVSMPWCTIHVTDKGIDCFIYPRIPPEVRPEQVARFPAETWTNSGVTTDQGKQTWVKTQTEVNLHGWTSGYLSDVSTNLPVLV